MTNLIGFAFALGVLAFLIWDIRRRLKNLASETFLQKLGDGICAFIEILTSLFISWYLLLFFIKIVVPEDVVIQSLKISWQLLGFVPLVLVLWGVYKLMKHSTKAISSGQSDGGHTGTAIRKTGVVAGATVLYGYISAMSVMVTDSCSTVGCPIVPWLMTGYAWLGGSLLLFGYAVYLGDISNKKWLRLFYPYVALPIFFIIIVFGMSTISS